MTTMADYPLQCILRLLSPTKQVKFQKLKKIKEWRFLTKLKNVRIEYIKLTELFYWRVVLFIGELFYLAHLQDK